MGDRDNKAGHAATFVTSYSNRGWRVAPAMSISFESEDVQLQKLRERLRKMPDAELILFGKAAL